MSLKIYVFLFKEIGFEIALILINFLVIDNNLYVGFNLKNPVFEFKALPLVF